MKTYTMQIVKTGVIHKVQARDLFGAFQAVKMLDTKAFNLKLIKKEHM